jgi:hypothetical protein
MAATCFVLRSLSSGLWCNRPVAAMGIVVILPVVDVPSFILRLATYKKTKCPIRIASRHLAEGIRVLKRNRRSKPR